MQMARNIILIKDLERNLRIIRDRKNDIKTFPKYLIYLMELQIANLVFDFRDVILNQIIITNLIVLYTTSCN